MSRTLPTLLLVGGIVSCSESPTDLHRVPLRLALAPRFSPQAEAIYRSLSAFAVTLDNVHVVVRGVTANDAPGPVLKDTTIAFPATASEITIDIDLAIQGSEQGVVAAVDLREGTDATIVTYGATVQRAFAAANQLADAGISAEVIDLRSLSPWDQERVYESVRRTNRAMVLYEDSLSWGYGAEIAARIADECFSWLDAPVKRVAAADTYVGYAPQLEDAILPQVDDIKRAIEELVKF